MCGCDWPLSACLQSAASPCLAGVGNAGLLPWQQAVASQAQDFLCDVHASARIWLWRCFVLGVAVLVDAGVHFFWSGGKQECTRSLDLFGRLSWHPARLSLPDCLMIAPVRAHTLGHLGCRQQHMHCCQQCSCSVQIKAGSCSHSKNVRPSSCCFALYLGCTLLPE